MTLPKGFVPQKDSLPKGFVPQKDSSTDFKRAESTSLTEKELLLKILEKMTLIDKSLELMRKQQMKDSVTKEVDRRYGGYPSL